MSPALRTYRPPAHLLNVIIPNRRRRLQRPIHIVLMHDPPLLGRMPPNPRIAVRLQLQIDRQLLRFARILLAQPLHLRLRPQQVLHMVSEFMRNHVRLRKVPRIPA